MGTRNMPGHTAAANCFSYRWLQAMLFAALSFVAAFAASPAQASLGYELDKVASSIDLAGQNPHGIAVDQASQRIYAAMATSNEATFAPGQIERLESNGTPVGPPLTTGEAELIFTGVAVNPVNQSIYASQALVSTPFGNLADGR